MATKRGGTGGEAVRASDERFWQDQQRRLTRQIGQPCCSLSGMSTLLAALPGRFAVVIHGDADCANCFVPYQGGSAHRFYSTRVSQVQFVGGRAREPLRRCLELVIRRRSPEAVFVLGTCLTEMVHDDFEAEARRAFEATGVPVLALRTSGLKAGSQQEMIDWLYSSLASLSARPSAGSPAAEGRVNILGLPPVSGPRLSALAGPLAEAGLELNALYPFDAGLEEWRRIGEARASFVVDPSLYPRLLGRLKALGQDCVEVPLPVGLGPTRSFFLAVGRTLGRSEAMERALEPREAAARARLADFRARFGPLRVALGLRMVNNYRADQLAYDGLGDLALFEEAGFKVTLLIQGPPDEKARAHFRARLDQLGCGLDFHVFPDPIDLPPLLKAGRFDLAYLADHAKGEARKAGVPLVRGRSLAPFYEGVGENLDFLERAIEGLGRPSRHGT